MLSAEKQARCQFTARQQSSGKQAANDGETALLILRDALQRSAPQDEATFSASS
jgi:hypothetical protein